MGQAIAFLTALVNRLGPKVKDVWPNILTIYEQVKIILQKMTDQPKLSFASRPMSDHGGDLARTLITKGIDEDEAKQVASLFETVDGHLS